MTCAGHRDQHGCASPFDAIAADYDRDFTETWTGRTMRDAVWRRIDARFRPGDRVIDLGCGTGEDAVRLASRGVRVVAIDSSDEMVRAAMMKAHRHGVAGLVSFHRADLTVRDQWRSIPDDGTFDGALSNFGALNCVEDLRGLADGLAPAVRSGGTILLCMMGPLVPWEWLWFLARGDVRKALRRMRFGGALWQGMRVRYPSVNAVRRAFARGFAVERIAGLGALMPPPFAEMWIKRHIRLAMALARAERRLESLPPVPWLADHYLIEMVRK